MILHRRAAQRQPMIAAQQADGLGSCRIGVLHGLRLIQHHVIERHLGEFRGIANQRSIRRQHEIVIADPRRSRAPAPYAPGRGAAA